MLLTIRSVVSRLSSSSSSRRRGLSNGSNGHSGNRTEEKRLKTNDADTTKSTGIPPTKAILNKTTLMTLVNEHDIDEKFISGSGPGGQCVNKAVNCCQIKHRPTGIVIKVHHTRSLEQNRKIARELLAKQLDNLYNGQNSLENRKKLRALHNASVREAQAERRRAMKEQFKKTLAMSGSTTSHQDNG